ncbi:MAG: EAL domain-containing protein [Pseudomonadota bacterium]
MSDRASDPSIADMSRKLRQYEMAEHMGDIGHWYWTVGSEAVEWSPQTFRIHGLEPSARSVALEDAITFYHPDEREMVETRLAEAIDQKSSFDFESRLLLANGEIRYVRSEGACELRGDGDVHALFGVFQDITERCEVERQMRSLQKRQSDFIEVSTDWVWEMDRELRFTYMSEQVEEVTGVPVDFHIGKTRRELMASKDLSLEMEMHLAWLDTHQPFKDFRFWRAGPDGKQQYISSSGTPYYDENGEFAGYRGVGRDLTDFQKAKEELLAANRKLNVANKAKSDAMGRLKEANAQLESRNAEMQTVQREIEHRAMHDPLTGIANRRYLDTKLEELAEQCSKNGGWIGALHIDLDRFKQINDTLGHAAGDAVLRHVAAVLAQNVPQDDFVARVGGDEFVVICSGHGGEEMLGSLAARLIDEFSRPVTFEGRECWFGASVGIATMHGDLIDAKGLLVNADVALYRAKSRGRGCFTFFSDELQQEVLDYKAIADGILAGLKRSEFTPWFQPQVCARTYEIIGVEALARWESDKRGVRAPDAFLSIAEDLSVVATIDRMILEKAVSAMQGWADESLNVPRLSVNVSSKRLMDDKLISSLQEMDLPKGMISFELLESVFLDDVEETISWNIDMLKEMGIDVELDDFGSGHASLISLVQLGPDAIKIDRQLIAAMTLDDARLNLVRSIVDICRSLNVRVVAEGVENAREAELLRQMSCDILQGYFIAKPMRASEFSVFLRNWSPGAFREMALDHRRAASG